MNAKRLKSNDFDLIHYWGFNQETFKLLAKVNSQIVIDIAIFGVLSNYNHKKGSNLEFITNHAKHFTVPSSFIKNTFSSMVDPDLIHLNYFGVDVKHNYVKVYDNNLIFLFVGEVGKRKGADYLLKAWQKFDPKDNEILIFCGFVKKEIKRLHKALKVKNVQFKGIVDPKRDYEEADIFILPSLKEGSSKSIFEAMSYRLPIITTENAGSIVNLGSDGLIIETKNIEQIVKSLNFFRDNPHQARLMGDRAFDNVKKYTWEAYAERAFVIYDKIINTKNTQ